MSKNYDYELTYSVDREGTTETVDITEIPYDIYKAAQPHFEGAADKALRLIINDIAEAKGKMIALGHIDAKNTIAIQSIETGLAEFIAPIRGSIKKKSKSTQLNIPE
jgi:hypothetical protein